MKTATVLILVVLIAMDMGMAYTLGSSSETILLKPGKCPMMPPRRREPCIRDEDCPRSQRCCKFRFGRVCTKPVFRKPDNNGEPSNYESD